MTSLRASSGSGRLRALLLILTFFRLSLHLSSGQVLTGRITDNSGQPVMYATIFISQIRQGTTTNTRGDYDIRLPAGSYTVYYQSLGYEPETINVTLTTDTIRRDITLHEQVYQIEEVRIASSGEDPAYKIMRRTIGMAPFHLNQIIHYKADVYLKGNLYIKRIPGLIKRQMKIEARKSSGGSDVSTTIKEGDSYFMESFNEIEFTAPDNYIQKVISYNSTFPSEGNQISPMDYVKASFYEPIVANIAISPLSPAAFSHYSFKYLGATPQGEYTIDKIEVIPKHKSQQLFSGTLYIVDELSCLQSIDLTNDNIAGTVEIKQLYIPVQQGVWMPVSHNFNIEIGILGFRADASYGSSVRYLTVEPDPKLKRPEEAGGISAGEYIPSDTVVNRNRQKIDEILKKEELSNRDMARLSKLMKKESENGSDSARKSLEVKDNTRYIVEKDAAKKDSLYWENIRPIPLSESEIRSIRVSDSLKAATKKARSVSKDTTVLKSDIRKNRFGKFMSEIAFGHTWSDTTGTRLRFEGFIKLRNVSFNTVDGFRYGVDFRLSGKLGKHGTIGLYPGIRYAFSRNKLLWHANLNYSSGGLKPWQIYLRSAVTSRDFNSQGGINPLLNSATSLLLEKNYLKLYNSQSLLGGFRIEPSNGLQIECSAGFESRSLLENHSSFSIFRSSNGYTPNLVTNDYLSETGNPADMPGNQKHFEIVTNVTFTPYQKYRMYNGNKSDLGSDWPEFSLLWKHGIDRTVSFGSSHFDMFSLSISHRKDLGAFNQIRWKVRTGGFPDNRKVSFFDFFHFNSQPFTVLIDDYDDMFMLPSYYSLSTPEFFGEGHLKYTTPCLILKLLPGLSNTLIRENLSLSYLGSRNQLNYTEIGYSLSEILFIGEAGVYAGFRDLKFSSAGVKLVFRFN